MTIILLAAALSQTIVPTTYIDPGDQDPCALFDETPSSAQAQRSAFTLDDQVRIADIGRTAPTGAPSAFEISPDGERIAFVVKRANPQANAYCLRLVVTAMDGSETETEIDRGGEFIRDDFPLRDFPTIMGGWDRPNAPRWSPDGARIGYLKRIDGSTQVWIADPAGGNPTHRATAMPDDVDRFAWTADGNGLIVQTRPGIRQQAEAIAQEAARGFLFDDRFSPQFADRPIPTGEIAPEYVFVALGDGSVRPATASEAELLVAHRPATLPAQAREYAAGPDGYAAWLEPKHPDRLISPSRIAVMQPGGSRISCDAEACEGIRQLWWTTAGQTLLALQGTGWANSQMAILRWDMEEGQPRSLLTTDDVLIGCGPFGNELVCAREGAARPRRIVAIDIRTGAERVVYDPNPDLANAVFGTVQRLRFRNAYGSESFADLVLPPDHRPGQQHPLVVVQYTSDGFLRGGTGDEVPIHPLANRGFAVLSFDRPTFSAAALTATSEEELVRANRADWIDRRRVQSSLEIALELAIETGAVDAGRMGISGFSDGGSTVQWALINSDLFQVASMGSCCEDMYSYPTAAGPRFTDFVRAMGYRHFEPGTEEFWRPMSLILNVDTVDVPILIQTGDSEYEGGLDVIETYSHRGRAIELYVLENETHVKWQPAHRQAIYERSTEWFEFWLMNRINCDPARAQQYRRWSAMEGAPSSEELQCFDGQSLLP